MSDAPRDPAPPPRQRPRPKYGEYATPQEQAEIIAKSMPPVSPLLAPSQLAPSQLAPHGESVPVPSGLIEQGEPTGAGRSSQQAPPAGDVPRGVDPGWAPPKETPAQGSSPAGPPEGDPAPGAAPQSGRQQRLPSPGAPRPESSSRLAGTGPLASAHPGRRRWDVLLSIALLTYGLLTSLAGFAQYTDVPALMNEVFETQSIGRFTPTTAAATAGIAIILINVLAWALAVWLTVRRLMSGRIAFWIPLTSLIVVFVVTGAILGVVVAGDPAFQSYLEGMTPGA